jgi:hypothetical protein
MLLVGVIVFLLLAIAAVGGGVGGALVHDSKNGIIDSTIRFIL